MLFPGSSFATLMCNVSILFSLKNISNGTTSPVSSLFTFLYAAILLATVSKVNYSFFCIASSLNVLTRSIIALSWQSRIATDSGTNFVNSLTACISSPSPISLRSMNNFSQCSYVFG